MRRSLQFYVPLWNRSTTTANTFFLRGTGAGSRLIGSVWIAIRLRPLIGWSRRPIVTGLTDCGQVLLYSVFSVDGRVTFFFFSIKKKKKMRTISLIRAFNSRIRKFNNKTLHTIYNRQ